MTLTGTVDGRDAKRRAEDIADSVPGVTHVQNNLRVQQSGSIGGRCVGYVGSSRQSTASGLGQDTTGGTGTNMSQTAAKTGRRSGV